MFSKPLCALFITALMLMVIPSGPSLTGADTGSITLDRLGKGSTSLELFVNDLGEHMNLTIPSNARIEEASLSIKGMLPPIIGSYDVGIDPMAITGADVDGDGDMDLGVVNSKSDTVSVLLNEGNGNFGKTKSLDFSVGRGPQDLVLTDLNGDDKVDLATANYDDGTVTVRLTSTEMFGSTAEYIVGGSPQFLLQGDLDGDEHPDLVVVRKEFPVVSVLFNKGDGAFNPSIDVKVKASPEGAVLTDIDGDKDLDLVIASTDRPYSIMIIENKGSKRIEEGMSYEVEWPPSDIVAMDLSNDGMMDLVISSAEGNISILLNNGLGFKEPRELQYSRQWALFPVDLNDDGVDDLVSVARVDSTVRTFINGLDWDLFLPNGDPVVSLELDQDFIMGNNPNDMFMADLDGDGDPDMATADIATDSTSVALNNGRGRFVWYDMYDIGDSDKAIRKGDVDGDGDMDLISSNYNQQTVTIAYNSGRGVFRDHVVREGYRVYPPQGGAGASEPFIVTTADYDGDGDIDVEYGEELTFAIIMMFNEGNGKWDEQSVALNGSSNLLPAPPFVTIPVDIDGDNDIDIVTNHINHDYISILLNDGTGHFITRLNHSLDGRHPYDMVATDFDGDGDIDFITANFGEALDFENALTLIRNDGDGKFTNIKDITVKLGPRNLAITDMNNDGLKDLVVAFAARKGLSDIVPGEIAVLLADGKEGTYKDPVYYRAGILPGSIHTSDLNEDQAQDVICINQGTGSGGSISILMNKGDGTLKPQIEYPNVPFSLGEFNDFLGDGRDEIVLPVLSTHLAIYRALYYPGDVSLKVGEEIAGLWGGIFKSQERVNLTEPLTNALKIASKKDKGATTIQIPIDVEAVRAGVIRIKDVHIKYTISETPGPKDEELHRLDLNDPGTTILLIMLGILILISVLVAAPTGPEQIEERAHRERRGRRKKKRAKGKNRAKRKRKVRSTGPSKRDKEPVVKVEVKKKRKKRTHKDKTKVQKMEKALKMREKLMKDVSEDTSRLSQNKKI